MRISFLWVIPLILAMIGGVWTYGVRGKDFLAPPSAVQLDAIRARVEVNLAQQNALPQPEPPPPVVIPTAEPILVVLPKKEVDLGDLTKPLVLTLYNERAPEGSSHLIALAKALEDKGHFNRALLAWERVLDLTRPNGEQFAAASAAIRRIHPTLPSWNSEPSKTIAITLHAGTGKSMAKTLQPVLNQVADDLSIASSGILNFSVKIAAGKSNRTAEGPAPIALWLAGPTKNGSATEVLSFKVDSKEQLRHKILGTIFQLMRGHLNQTTSYTTPAALASDEDPLEALSYRFTRLCWHEFGTSLTLPAQKQLPAPRNP
jgi:hypothetical protein